MRKKAQYEFIPLSEKSPGKPPKNRLPSNLRYTITKSGTVAIVDNHCKHTPKCKIFTPAEIQEYIKSQKTGA